MKRTFFFRTLLVSAAVLFAATGCKDDDNGPVTPAPTLSASMTAGDADGANQDSALSLKVTAKDVASGVYKVMTTEEYEAAGQPDDEIAATGTALTDAQLGGEAVVIANLTAGTEYTAIVQVTGNDKSTLVKTAKATTKAPDAPSLELALVAGDADGANTDTNLLLTVTTDATSGVYKAMTTADYNTAVAAGQDDEALAAGGTDLDNVNGTTVISGLESETSYTVVVLVTSDNGLTTANHKVAATEAPANGPSLDLSTAAGEDPMTMIELTVTAPDAVSGLYKAMTSADYNAAITGGQTNKELLANGTTALTTVTGVTEISRLTPGTEYTIIVRVAGADESTTTKTIVASTTAPIPGPDLELSMEAGNGHGVNTDYQMYMGMTSLDAVSAIYGLFDTSDVEAALAAGDTYDTFLEANGEEADDEFMGYLTDPAGLGLTYGSAAQPLDPSTSYTFIIRVAGANGGTTTKYAEASTTAPAGPATPVTLPTFTQGLLAFAGQIYTSNQTGEKAPCNTFFMQLTNAAKQTVGFELQTALSATTDIPVGTYTMMSGLYLDELVPFKMAPGTIDDEGTLGGTFYLDNGAQLYYLFNGMSSTVTIAKSGQTYTITMNLTDVKNNVLCTGTYTGALTFQDISEPSSLATSMPLLGRGQNTSHYFTSAVVTTSNGLAMTMTPLVK